MRVGNIFMYMHIIKKKNLQQKNNNRNRAALQYLQGLGFFMPEIRKALVDLNEIRLKSMVCKGTSFCSLSRTIRGTLNHAGSKEILAHHLMLTVTELFPEERKE